MSRLNHEAVARRHIAGTADHKEGSVINDTVADKSNEKFRIKKQKKNDASLAATGKDTPVSDKTEMNGARTDEIKPMPRPGRTVPAISTVLDLLETEWGQEELPNIDESDEPLDGLILTILSQNTNDRNRDQGYDSMWSRWGSWEKIAALSQPELADAIRPAGICNIKSGTILRVLARVKEHYGAYSLKKMKSGTPGEAWEFLTSLQGVGPKTAAVVMVFDLGFPAFPVDTHVSRMCRRLGWAPENETPAEIQARMEPLIPDSRKGGAHLNLILHGRNICKSRSPLCARCPLRSICPSSNC